ncbi:hypothetical protein LJC12_05290 [Odoribacter sp. OttesenSCG-928-J03]|nr:hypothetical protein [Odoribacter sp. OttesenSCG-928-J03]MDL2283467.1 hypothetical protein [Odoribacter sp. OttesenSCG-928-G04]
MFFLSASANILIYFLVPVFFFLCICTKENVDLQELFPVSGTTTLVYENKHLQSEWCYAFEQHKNKPERRTDPNPIVSRFSEFIKSPDFIISSLFLSSPETQRGPPYNHPQHSLCF